MNANEKDTHVEDNNDATTLSVTMTMTHSSATRKRRGGNADEAHAAENDKGTDCVDNGTRIDWR